MFSKDNVPKVVEKGIGSFGEEATVYMEQAIADFVDCYNYRRYHQALSKKGF